MIASQHAVYCRGFPSGQPRTNITATKFTGLVARLLKQGQPGIVFLISSTANVLARNNDYHSRILLPFEPGAVAFG